MWVLYFKENTNYIDRKDLDTYIKKDKYEFGAKWIEIINKKGKKFVIASVYRHPGKNDNEFQNYMQKTLAKLNKENKLLFITGDFNYNLLNTKRRLKCSLILCLHTNYTT